MGNEEHLLARTALLAGEIMLVSGAEIARIEDTIHHILGCCPDRKAQTMVFSTGIFVSLDNSRGEAITLVRRVNERSTNLGRIYCGYCKLVEERDLYRSGEDLSC